MTKEQINILANRIASNAVARLFLEGLDTKRLLIEGDGWTAGGWDRKRAFDEVYKVAVEALTDAARVIDAAQDVMLAAILLADAYLVDGRAFEELRDSLESINVPTFQPKQVGEIEQP